MPGSPWVASAAAAPARARGLTVAIERPPKTKGGAKLNGEMTPEQMKRGLENYEREYLKKVAAAQERTPLGLAFLAVTKVPPFRRGADDDSGGTSKVGGTETDGTSGKAENGSRGVWPKSFFDADSEDDGSSEEEESVNEDSGGVGDSRNEGLESYDAWELVDPFRSRPEHWEDVGESLGIEAAQATLVQVGKAVKQVALPISLASVRACYVTIMFCFLKLFKGILPSKKQTTSKTKRESVFTSW